MIEPNIRKTVTKFPVNTAPGFAPQMIEVVQDVNSFQHLRCMCDMYLRKKWCPHIEDVYTNSGELDRDHIASTCGVQIYKPPRSLIVPVLILSQTLNGENRVPFVGGKAHAEFDQTSAAHSDSRLCEVRVLFGKVNYSTAKGEINADGVTHIGFIVRTVQGRRTLRRLVIDWLVAIPFLYPERMKCGASYHSKGDCYFDTFGDGTLAGEQTDRLTDTKAEAWRVRDSYSLIDNGSCYSCVDATRVPFDAPF